MRILFILFTLLSALDASPLSDVTEAGSVSATTSSAEGIKSPNARSPVCDALKRYPRAEGEKASFESGDISPICKPFVHLQRKDLDRCGDTQKDPYTSKTTATISHFTWASRNEMSRKGKGNLYTDADLQPQLPILIKHVEQLKESAARLCCASNDGCRKQFDQVEVSFCKPSDDPNVPDPCVFGGSYKMPGRGYTSIFRAIHKVYGEAEANEFRRLADKNLRAVEGHEDDSSSGSLNSGSIVLSSYISRATGTASVEPVILHELGHACSMVHMQQASLQGREAPAKALRAAAWLDRARSRCNQELELPEAYYDFWESVGESRGLAQCLYNLTNANLKQQVDRPCPSLCPGHYMEESVGIAFSLLLGKLDGAVDAVYPNTCDHVRDGQHPMVSDVADCLMQNSPRFRERMKRTYGCQ